MDVIDTVASWPNELVEMLQRYAAAIAFFIMVVLLLIVAYLVWRETMTYRSLMPARRRRYVVRSTGPNKWPMEELERWAAQVSMIRRRVRRYMDRPAHAVRIRLESTPQGARYTMEGSWRIERVMDNPALSGIAVKRVRIRTGQDARRQGPDTSSSRRPNP